MYNLNLLTNQVGVHGLNGTLTAAEYQALLAIFCQSSRCHWPEVAETCNNIAGWSKLLPSSIKALNPNARTYRTWSMLLENTYANETRLTMPIPNSLMDANGWWLKDATGNPVKIAQRRVADVGKPGFTQAVIDNIRLRTNGKGFDGVWLDDSHPDLSAYINPLPVGYASDADWQAVYMPHISAVVNALRGDGYRICGNAWGYSNQGGAIGLQRDLLDECTYEQFMFESGSGAHLPQATQIAHANALANDPLEVWVSNLGLKKGVIDFDAKHKYALAVYYAFTPNVNANSFSADYSTAPYHMPLWDFDIGTPFALAQQPYTAFYARAYSKGMALVNMSATQNIAYPLFGSYIDSDGIARSGTISVPPRTGLILQTVSAPIVIPTTTTPTTTKPRKRRG